MVTYYQNYSLQQNSAFVTIFPHAFSKLKNNQMKRGIVQNNINYVRRDEEESSHCTSSTYIYANTTYTYTFVK